MAAAHRKGQTGSRRDAILADARALLDIKERMPPRYPVNSQVRMMSVAGPPGIGCYTIMSDIEKARDDELMAIPRLAERVGVTPRVLRYWEEQELISPTREHGKLRYSPRDLAIAGLIRRLLDAGAGVEGVRMLRRIAERDIRRSAASGEETVLAEEALRILYQRKAFYEETGTDEEHYPKHRPPPPPPPHGPPNGPKPRHRPGRPPPEHGPGTINRDT
jgi:DNA-binding transcriptional MerR regulator